MALPEDAASVLEQFIHDVANIPAEITHLLEEIQAKDTQIQTFQKEIARRDHQLQKWVYANGGHVRNPKEEAFSKVIHDCYDKCEILQAEKCGLSEKAMIVLDRQVKRLDIGLRGLAQSEQFPSDWTGPSLLTNNGNGGNASLSALTGADSTASSHAASAPLQAISGNATSTPGGAPNYAHQAAQLRLAQSISSTGARGGSISGASTGAQTPTNLPRTQREGSSEASNKRRRTGLGQSLNIPASASSLRQSSLGPGTPKAGTPGPGGVSAGGNTSSRAGSAQPSRPGNGGTQKKGGPGSSTSASGGAGSGPNNTSSTTSTTGASQPSRKVAPPPSKKANRARPSAGAPKKSDRRRHLARDRATPSTNASHSGSDDDGDSASPTTPTSSVPRSQIDGSADPKAGDDDDVDDDQLYCLCQKVSFGDMVGCDNDNCRFQWFHYKCVNVTEEPVGEWLCPECRNMPRSKLRISKD